MKMQYPPIIVHYEKTWHDLIVPLVFIFLKFMEILRVQIDDIINTEWAYVIAWWRQTTN